MGLKASSCADNSSVLETVKSRPYARRNYENVELNPLSARRYRPQNKDVPPDQRSRVLFL